MALRIDLHCPVELTGYELLHDDRGRTRAYLQLFNLSSQRISRLEAVAHFTDEDGNDQAQSLCQQLDAGPRKAFTLSAAADALPGATGLWLAFTKLKFESGRPDWIGHPGRLTEIPDLPAPDGRDLNKLMAIAGRDAVCFPRRAGAYWLCVCGRPNACRRKTCLRCGRDREQVLTLCDMAQVLKSRPILTPSGDRIELPLMEGKPPSTQKENAAQLLRRKFLRQRSLLVRRTLTMLVIALLLVLGAWLATALQKNAPPESIPPVKVQQQPSASPQKGGASVFCGQSGDREGEGEGLLVYSSLMGKSR